MGVSKNSDNIKINIKVSKPSLEISTSSRVPNWLNDMDVFCTYKINFERKIWNMGVSKTTYLYFGSREESKLLWANLIWIKIELESWPSLSWVFLSQTNLSKKWSWGLRFSELSFSEPNYCESKLNLRGELLWAKLLWAKLIWVKIEFESWASLSQSQLSWACSTNYQLSLVLGLEPL